MLFTSWPKSSAIEVGTLGKPSNKVCTKIPKINWSSNNDNVLYHTVGPSSIYSYFFLILNTKYTFTLARSTLNKLISLFLFMLNSLFCFITLTIKRNTVQITKIKISRFLFLVYCLALVFYVLFITFFLVCNYISFQLSDGEAGRSSSHMNGGMNGGVH